MADKLEYVSQPLSILPSAANGVSVTPNAVAFSNSSYTQITASIGSDITLASLVYNAGTQAVEVEVDIATGGAGSEVVMATIRFAHNNNTSLNPFNHIPLPVGINNIANGSRVSVRMRKTGTNTSAWLFAIMYYTNPTLGITTTTNASNAIPSAAAGGSITTGTTAWANTAYTQLIASTSSAQVLGGVAYLDSTSEETEVDIATGAAAAEVVITTVRFNQLNAGPQVFLLQNPLDKIANATRVAARLRHSTTTSSTARVALLTYNSPL